MAFHSTFLKRSSKAVKAVTAVAMVVAVLPALQLTAATQAAADPGPGSITLHVQSARTVNAGAGFVHKGDPVTKYKWLINVDDTGNPGTAAQQGLNACLPATAPGGSADPQYADTCQWPSTRTTSGVAPIAAQGDETDLNDGKALDNLPAGKYLISVTADGFKIDGKHFTVNGGTQRVNVEMNPTPLPLTTLRIEVFNDNTPVDATYEVDAEHGLAGFSAALSDVMGLVSTDYYGNALCTKYMRTNGGALLFTEAQRPNLPVAFADGKPVIDPA
ncbi:MAG: hypothetical protein QOG98_3402, partial [Pseudonocardiales bacterium]|nr:hypothetical protein [Pseudonocardiales bacterium]